MESQQRAQCRDSGRLSVVYSTLPSSESIIYFPDKDSRKLEADILDAENTTGNEPSTSLLYF